MSKKNICVFTGTRAEYGLLKPLMEEIKKDSELELDVVVSGMHLSPEFGLTYKEIERDGFYVSDRVEMLLSSDTPVGVAKSIGLGIIGYSDALDRLKPEIVVVLGDRFEAMAFALASFTLRIPIAHLYGGELTMGVIDDGYRHSITKLSTLHFTSTEEYRKRVIQLGEEPSRVFNVGALGLDNIKRLRLLKKEEVEERLGVRLKRKNLLITFHPVSVSPKEIERQTIELLSALDSLEDALLIFTKANADSGGRKINEIIERYVENSREKAVLFSNMGQLLYLSTMQFVDAVVGNSSSGIIEAPSFKIGTINIGDRQRGRVKAKSVLDCSPDRKSIKKAIEQLYSESFQKELKRVTNPYGDGNAAQKIVEKLKSWNGTMEKSFYDIDFKY